jgi:hypothetical protein
MTLGDKMGYGKFAELPIEALPCIYKYGTSHSHIHKQLLDRFAPPPPPNYSSFKGQSKNYRTEGAICNLLLHKKFQAIPLEIYKQIINYGGFMNRIKTLLAATLGFAIILTSCTTSMKQRSLTSESDMKLMRNKIVYIASAEDGTFNGKVYLGSGKSVTNMFSVNLRPYVQKITIGQEDIDFAQAKMKDAHYIVKPTILHWEPRAAAWSGIPTRLEIHVSIYTSDENEIISRDLEVKGRSWTFASQSVEELAEIIIKQFCADVF